MVCIEGCLCRLGMDAMEVLVGYDFVKFVVGVSRLF